MEKKKTAEKIIKTIAVITAGFCILAVAAFGIADAVAYSYKHVEEDEWDYTFWISDGKKDEPSGGGDKIVEVKEEFKESEAQNVTPGTCFGKTIDLKSYAGYESYGYILVEIPAIQAMKAEDTSLKVYDCAQPQINTSYWELIYQKVAEEAGRNSKYIYRYKTALQPGESTETDNDKKSLCISVRIPEFTEVSGESREMKVTAYLIQTTGFETGTLENPGTADTEAIQKLTE